MRGISMRVMGNGDVDRVENYLRGIYVRRW